MAPRDAQTRPADSANAPQTQAVRVLVPYLRLSARTKQALEGDGYQPIYVQTLGPLGYIDALETMWNTGEGFCVVEQDKVPWPGALRTIWECPEDWCVFPCRMWQTGRGADFPSLSTVKFSDAMVGAYPDFMATVRTI